MSQSETRSFRVLRRLLRSGWPSPSLFRYTVHMKLAAQQLLTALLVGKAIGGSCVHPLSLFLHFIICFEGREALVDTEELV